MLIFRARFRGEEQLWEYPLAAGYTLEMVQTELNNAIGQGRLAVLVTQVGAVLQFPEHPERWPLVEAMVVARKET